MTLNVKFRLERGEFTMKHMKKIFISIGVISLLLTGSAHPVEIADYTAYPPFLPRIVSPNILFVLDYSASMVRPAYGTCTNITNLSNCRTTFSHITDDYSGSTTYTGYFDNDNTAKYTCTSGGGASCAKNSSGAWKGNWLNWLSMTQFDVLKKVFVGGDLDPAPEGPNSPNKLRARLGSNPGVTIRKAMNIEDTTAISSCTGNVPSSLCTQWPTVSYSWANDSGATNIFTSSSLYPDNSVSAVDLPFTFYGTTYTQIFISTNGWISFTDPSGDSYPDNGDMDISNPAVPNNIIAPFWDDIELLDQSGSTNDSVIKTFTEGSSPNRIYHIRYEKMYHKNDGGKDHPLTFEILLYEGSNHIVFQYNDIDSGGGEDFGYSGSATIGIENSDGTKAKKYSYNGTTYNSQSTSTTLGNCTSSGTHSGCAIFATPHVSFAVTPGNQTTFNADAPLSSDTYQVYIDINNASLVSGKCPSTHPYYNADEAKKGKNPCFDHQTLGLFHDFRDGELAGTLGFRLGIMRVGVENTGTNGGEMKTKGKYFNSKDTASLFTSARGDTPTDKTPISEALYEAVKFFKQEAPQWGTDFDYDSGSDLNTCQTTGNEYDPFCFQSAAQKVECCKSFILMVSSGNYSHDFNTNIYGDANPGETPTVPAYCKSTLGNASCASSIEDTKTNGGWLDDVAYIARVTDWRSDMGGTQDLTAYFVNTFGSDSGDGTAVLKRAAKYGGFEDKDGNGVYDNGEDDSDSNGIPDTYFEASGGGDLKAKIVDAVSAILKSTASGTSVSVLSTSASGAGSIYQAYFYPAKIEGTTEQRTWPGFLRAFFLDKYQNLRDDYSGGTPDAALSMAGDRIAQMFLNTSTNEVRVKLFTDSDGNGTPDSATPDNAPNYTSMDDLISIWEGGKRLAQRDKNTRNIYLWLDSNADGVVDNGDFSSLTGEALSFVNDAAHRTALRYYLRAEDPDKTATTDGPLTAEDEAGYIIDYIRGIEKTGYRNRCITITGETADETNCTGSQKVWALGDIVYSTPTNVSVPAEQYDLIYGDSSYRAFRIQYRNKRSMLYVGANDGMLHAFNGGVFSADTSSFTANPSTGNGWTSPTPAIGDELWAFIPYDNLPHLAWLGCNGTSSDPTACNDAEYTHVYYVDLKPKATDAKIFNNSPSADCPGSVTGMVDGQSGACHPYGWGTLLIVGLRLGGGAIDVDLNGDTDTTDTTLGEQSFRSAFYAFDVTDPEKKPRLLWRFYDSGLGFTTSYPAIVRICNNQTNPCTGTEKWYMVVGSGHGNTTATNGRDYGGTNTTQAGKVFVIDLVDGIVDRTFTVETSNAIIGDPTVVDADFDFTSDVIYIGSAISSTSGKVYRINTNQDIAANWAQSVLISQGKPLLISPSVSKDSSGNLWVFFGTGRLRHINDLNNSEQQTFYGIKDACWKKNTTGEPCSTTYTTSDLMNVSNMAVCTTAAGGGIYDTASGSCTSTSYSSYNELLTAARSASNKGWYLNLIDPADPAPSERVLARSVVLGGIVLFTTYKPTSNMCSVFGDSLLYALYYETGTAYSQAVVGTTGDTVDRTESLGEGMPTAVGVAIGENVVGYVQKSTGEIVRIETHPAFAVRSGPSSWKEKAGGGGTIEIEQIYRHIVK